MKDWLITNWLAIFALIVAFVGGWPGLLKIREYFRPFRLSGSIKFYAPTSSVQPPEDGILVALTLINEGTKNFVWRKLKVTLKKQVKEISIEPKLIPGDLSFNNISPAESDLLNQQLFLPGKPYNGYLLLTAPSGSFSHKRLEPSELYLQFELESGKVVNINMPFVRPKVVHEGKTFPSHGVKF